ncbi:SSI family serine proteinase inhibitor [Streptomyces sp. NPDC052077]|uniref:SSI family serine proteinase inhibitor n=1 Tax=Streptomyces sp. NPDC052077 TaxID=3154757 RepID=UPI003415A125
MKQVTRILGAAAASAAGLAALCAAPPAAAAPPVAVAPPDGRPAALTTPAAPAASAVLTAPARVPARAGDRLTVTVRHAGAGADGTYVLFCHPARGTHPDPAGACDALDRGTRWGRDAFAPVPEGAMCTMQYGGPATARVTGTWAGRPVDAVFRRGDGCEIERWDRMVPLLPQPGSPVRP